jgi:hypothetical protein
MNHSYKLRDFFFKTIKATNKIKQQEKIKTHQKTRIIEELEDDLFYLKETAKKMLRKQDITSKDYEKIIQKITNINLEIKKIKKQI